MKYHSTRGGQKDVSFKDVLFMGYAKDGGMFLPQSVPQINADTLRKWANLSYTDLAFEVLSCFLDDEDVPAKDLKDILNKSFSTFDVPEVVPVARLANDLVIMELYHGRSLSFKDLAMSCLGNFFNYFLANENRNITLLVCTSGDTGSSAIEAMKGLSNIDIIVILPRGRISQIQEKQMTTVLDSNVHVFRVDGSSDDGDVIVKGLFADTEFAEKHNIGSASSLNFCRIMVQLVHFFYSYLKLCPEADREVELILPTGGGGNTAAGMIAQRMGLPVKFVCAVNHNNALARFIDSGHCDLGEVETTIAPAMDIMFPYNFERVWFMCSEDNAEETKTIMEGVDNKNTIRIPIKTVERLRNAISVFLVTSNSQVEAAMKRCWEENGYAICPHTGVGVAAFYAAKDKEQDGSRKLRAVLATASPLKFPEAAVSAGIPAPTSDKVMKVLTAPTRYSDLEKGDDWIAAVKECAMTITARRENRPS